MTRYEILRVLFKVSDHVDQAARLEEIDRYFYGRHFNLAVRDSAELAGTFEVFVLCEDHFAQAVIDRLASGLFTARRANHVENAALLGHQEEGS